MPGKESARGEMSDRGEQNAPRSEFDGDPGGTASSMWRSNRGVALLLMVVLAAIAIYIWQSDWAHRVMRDGFRLGGFPMIGVILMAIFAGVLIFDRRARLVEPELASLTLFSALVALGLLALLYLTFQAYWLIGFAPSVAIFVIGVAVALGYRPVWIAILTGLGTAVVLRVIAFALGVPVPDGPLATPLVRLIGL
jgi:hypothetical protein